MESLPGDPYERQLLEVFKSCDCDGKGFLDNDGLSKLCELLHLEDGREELMSCLLPNGNNSSTSLVTFNKFRDALLALLGGVRERQNRSPSPDREVSPKYVYGEKKYGRRSRPESTEELDIAVVNDNNINGRNKTMKICTSLHSDNLSNNRLRASQDLISIDRDSGSIDDIEQDTLGNILINKECEDSGETELRNAWERLGVGREGYLHPKELAMVCSAVGMDTMADQVVTQVFSTLKTDDEGRISFEEFLDLFRSKTRDSSPQLLESNQNQFNKLSNLLDLNDVGVTGTTKLFQELQIARSQLEAVTAERDKLRADLADANHRATILAQEVDEHHARIEKASKAKEELLEHKHAEEVKELKKQMAADKEHLLQTNQRLEQSLSEHVDQLNKLSSELYSLKKDCENMEKENQSLNNKLLESDNLKRDYQEQLECMTTLHQRVYELESLHEQSSGIIEKINNLQAENMELRDKNDELTTQLENLVAKTLQRKESMFDNGSGTKRRVKSPEDYNESRIGKVRRCCTETDLTLASVQHNGFCLRFLDQKGLEPEDDSYTIPPDQCWLDDDKDKMKAYITELEAKVQLLQQKEWLWKTNPRDGDSINTFLSADSTQVTCTSCDNSYVAISPVSFENVFDNIDQKTEIGIQTESPLGHLEKHCHELENELERVRDKIIKILSERRACSEENCVLKQTLQTLMKNNLKTENCDSNILKASLKFLPNPKDKLNNSNLEDGSTCLDSALTTNKDKEKMECLKCKEVENHSDLLESIQEENQRLTKRCQELETSLELMRVEYEKTEDYWENKLDEERRLFEQDQQQSDEKFADLEAKIQEYAELLSSEQSRKPSLPPIEEKDFLEKQFTDLEEEYELYKLENEDKLMLKNEEIRRLEQVIENFQQFQRAAVKDEQVQTNFGELSRYGSKYRQSCSTPRLASPRMENLQIFHSLSSRLRQQEIRCSDLQSALKQQQKQTEQILHRAWERHKIDLTTIQNSLVVTQEKLQQQRKNTKQQLERLSAADALVKDLCSENKNLAATIMSLEYKYQSASHSALPNSL